MRRGWLVPLFLSLLQAGPAARTACIPAAEAAERMDGYFAEPRGPATYRALAGLGDPRIPPHRSDQRGQPLFGEPEDWEGDEKLRRRMLPVEFTEMGGSTYEWVETGACRPGHALTVARRRVAALGSGHPYVEQWFAVQRAVFSACAGGGTKPVPLPPAMNTTDPGIARLQEEDRAYQRAARLFYQESPGAIAAFRRIAASASAHAPIARYMLLVLMAEPRALPEPAKGTDGALPPRKAVPAAAVIAEADRILTDPKLASIHPLVQGLIGSLAWNAARDYGRSEGDPPNVEAQLLRDAQVRLTLAALRLPIERLRSDPAARQLYARAAEDSGKLHRRFEDPAWWLTGLIPEDAYGSRAMAAAAKTDRFAAWLLYPPSPYRGMAWGRVQRTVRWDGRLHRITDSGGSKDQLAWRIAAEAVSLGEGGWSIVDEMQAEARRCAGDSALAALPELFYHTVRKSLMHDPYPQGRERAFAETLDRMAAWPWRESEHYRETAAAALRYLIEVGRIAEARRLRDRLLANGPVDWRFGTALLLLAEDESRSAAALAVDGGGEEALLNVLSRAALQRLAGRSDVSAEDRARFARVAWSRSYALGGRVPGGLDRLMRRLNPELAGGWRSKPGAGAGDRLLLLDVLRSPGLNILLTGHQRPYGSWNGDRLGLTGIDTFEHSDNNWWCAWQPARHEAALDRLLYELFFSGPDADEREADPLAVAGARRALAPLLASSWLWQARDAGEERALAQIDSAPRLLGGRAVAWASRGGKVRGQDEALALAVRATRYGCQRQGGHGAYSKAAFELLHRRFPQSAAARRTRHWFNCAHFSGGCPRPRRTED